MLMKYYERLVDLKCFSRSDVERLTKNKYTADSLIKEYKRKGYIESVELIFCGHKYGNKRAGR